MLDQQAEYQQMYISEEEMWWYRCLHNLILDTLHTHFPTKHISILDAGCGTGGLLNFLRANGFEDILGFDVSPFAITLAAQRNLRIQELDIREAADTFPPASFDTICSTDTLYFFDFESQLIIVEELSMLLKPGGLLILNCPHSSLFRGTHDVAVGIKERISRQQIERLSGSPSYEILYSTFWPGLLSPLIFIQRTIQRLMNRKILREQSDDTVHSDVKCPPRLINEMLYLLTRVEHRLCPQFPFGSSAFLVLKRKQP